MVVHATLLVAELRGSCCLPCLWRLRLLHYQKSACPYDSLSDLYNTDSYFHDCITHQAMSKWLLLRREVSLDLVRHQGGHLVEPCSPYLRVQAALMVSAPRTLRGAGLGHVTTAGKAHLITAVVALMSEHCSALPFASGSPHTLGSLPSRQAVHSRGQERAKLGAQSRPGSNRTPNAVRGH